MNLMEKNYYDIQRSQIIHIIYKKKSYDMFT